MKIRTDILLSLLIILLIPQISAGERIHRFHLDYRDGLCGNNIRSIGQDGQGYIWVATGDGLNQFDGRQFKSYTKENSGLESNELNCVIGDPTNKDVIWISTRLAGLYYFDHVKGEITRLEDGLSSPDIPWLSVTSDNKIWVTNYFDIPDLLDPATMEVTPLFKSRPKDFPTPIWCAVQDSDGDYLYIGHERAGLTIVNLHTKQPTYYHGAPDNADNIPSGSVYAIEIDSNGIVWLGTDDGVLFYNPQTGVFTPVRHDCDKNSLLPGAVRVIKELSDGDLWFGTMDGGVSILHLSDRISGTMRFDNITHRGGINEDENVSSPYIWAIYEDMYGNKWIGNHSDGIDVLSYESPFFVAESPFRSHAWHSSDMAVWSTLADERGNIWIGGTNEIMKVNHSKQEILHLPTYESQGHAQVKAMYADRDGDIWIGTNNSGAFVYNPYTNSFRPLDLPVKEIRAFVQDREGTMWIGTHSGIYKAKAGAMAEPDTVRNSQLADLYITSLLIDKKGNLWVGTFGKGLSVFNPEGTRTLWLQTANGLPSHTVNAIRDDGKGYMWVATRGGAVKVPISQKGDLLTVTHNDGLPSSDIRSIEIDKSGNVWLAANRGIACYSPDSHELLVYNRIYSTQLVSFSENASCIDFTGRMYFGLLSGLINFNPDQHESEAKSSSVTLTDLRVNDSDAPNQSLEIEIPLSSDKIKLPHNYNTFTLKFSSLDITQAANSDLAYNMVGVNEVWTPADITNEAIYRNLKPGDYTFRIRHRLHGKGWSDPIVLAHITITPPVYLTWWAETLYVVLAVAAIAFFILFYKHKLLLEKNLAVEKENSKNNQALNEERLIFFTNITHELRTPLSLIIGPIEDLVNDTSLKDSQRKKLHTIRTSSMRLLNLINGILEFRKTETRNRKLAVEHGPIANFVREIGLRFKELNGNKNVSIVIDVDQLEGVEIYYDSEMINIIINNLMSNAIKYTAQGTITLSLRKAEAGGVQYVDLIVADTGIGISKESLPYIFDRYYQADNAKKTSGTGIGLALTKNLVDLHEGTITVQSQEGVGSVFTVRLIMNNSYPNAKHKDATDVKTEDISENVKSLANVESGHLTLLVVEDDEDVRTYISQSFAGDFKVYTASNGAEGLKMAREKMPDIIVSDIMMPEMDGIELCRTLKNDFVTSHIPVILLTAKDSLLDKEEGYESGADSYITKPFSSNLLKSRINNIVESRHNITMRMLEIAKMPAAEEAHESEGPMQEPGGQEIQPSERPAAQLSKLDREFITKFRQLVEDNMEMEELDQTFLSDKMCMSLSTLYRKVKSISGFTPNEFIRKIKLRHAAELIVAKEVPISEIYALTGFGSAAYFRRVFKKEFGVSPSEYSPQSASSDAQSASENE